MNTLYEGWITQGYSGMIWMESINSLKVFDVHVLSSLGVVAFLPSQLDLLMLDFTERFLR